MQERIEYLGKDGYLYIGKHQLPIGRSYQENIFSKISKF